MLTRLKRSTLSLTRASGVDALLTRSSWRGQRVLILCYHGISIEREHEWDSELYMSPKAFERRLELLKKHRCSVLPLEDALHRAALGSLPPSSVVITFDDGMSDFHAQAMPLLQAFGFPATVYLTSFYSTFNRPIFFLACSYLLWKHQGHTPKSSGQLRDLESWVSNAKPSAEQQYAALEELAHSLGTDAAELTRQRILHVMTPAQVRDAADQGFDIELHTHRHRTPGDPELFAREIEQNRLCIQEWTGREPRHFCYPNGTVQPQFESWLRGQGIASGVTCVPGLASARNNPLLLPRLVDHSGLSEVEFESWISGSGALLRNLKLGR